MMHGLMLLLLLLGWCSSSSSSSSSSWEEDVGLGRVLELSEKNIETAIEKYEHILVDFYAPWCSHCKMLSPQLDAVAPRLAENDPPVVIAKVNVDKYTNLASKYKISAYPTLKLFSHGFPMDYDGPRQAASLETHIIKAVGPDWIFLSSNSNLSNCIRERGKEFPFFIHFGTPSSTFKDLARLYKMKSWFIMSDEILNSDAINVNDNEDDDVDMPCLVYLNQNHNERDVLYRPFKESEYASFIKHHLLPLVSELTFESRKNLKEDGRPIILAILNDQLLEKHSVYFADKLKSLALANRGFVFAYLNYNKSPEISHTFDIQKRSHLPTILVWDGNSEYFTTSNSYFYLDSENLESMISILLDEFKEGKATRQRVKSPSAINSFTATFVMRAFYAFACLLGLAMFYLNNSGSSPTKRTKDIAEKGWTQDSEHSSDSETSHDSIQSILDTIDKED